MELTFSTFLIVCPLVFLGAFVDAIAGGGGLITLPAYLLAGVPTHLALGSNKLSSTLGTAVSTGRYWKNKFIDAGMILPTVIAALIGSALGANLALIASEALLQYLLLAVLPLVAVLVMSKRPEMQAASPLKRSSIYIVATIAAFVIGAYDGFYGPGTGTFLVLIFSNVLKMDVKIASGNAKVINLASNIAALVTFLFNGKVLIPLALTASAFSILGHYLGAGMVMKNGTKIVRPVILLVLAILFVKVITEL